MIAYGDNAVRSVCPRFLEAFRESGISFDVLARDRADVLLKMLFDAIGPRGSRGCSRRNERHFGGPGRLLSVSLRPATPVSRTAVTLPALAPARSLAAWSLAMPNTLAAILSRSVGLLLPRSVAAFLPRSVAAFLSWSVTATPSLAVAAAPSSTVSALLALTLTLTLCWFRTPLIRRFLVISLFGQLRFGLFTMKKVGLRLPLGLSLMPLTTLSARPAASAAPPGTSPATPLASRSFRLRRIPLG